MKSDDWPVPMIRFLETPDRVFRLEITPDTPGVCKRCATLTLESGPPLTDDEWRQVCTDAVAGFVADGIDLIGWSYPEQSDD